MQPARSRAHGAHIGLAMQKLSMQQAVKRSVASRLMQLFHIVVRIRYPQGTFPAPAHRVVFDSRNLHVEAVQRKDTHEREVWLHCREDV